MTGRPAVRIIGFVRNTPVIRAACLAALLALGVSERAEARPRSHAPAGRKASAAVRAGHGSRLHARKATPARHRAARKPGRTAPAGRHGRRATAHGSRRAHARTLLHQNGRGEVVADRVGVVADAGEAIAGPSREMQNYPPAPCDGNDVVIEAHLHEAEPDAPESDSPDLSREGREEAEVASADPAPSGPRASISRIARKVGSFFRPKSSESEVKPQDVDLTELVSKDFLIPVAGVDAERLRDSFLSSRGRHAKHLAIDIGAPRGTPILATTDGEITRISRERRGGKSIYQKDATGQYLLFYCHLSAYADDLEVGRQVKKGDVIGYVGSTGHVIGGSHLHFSITRLPDDDSNFRKGLAINPYLLFLAGVP